MDYTKNYHLPQWVREDRILMEDFNDAMANIEGGLTRNADAVNKVAADAAAGSEAAASSALAAAKNAQDAADKALKDAAAAQAKADAAYCPSFQPYVTGTYMGTGEEQNVTTGFQPKFVIITCADGQNPEAYSLATGCGISSERLQFTSNGFMVKRLVVGSGGLQAPHINYQNKLYVYIAFR